MTRTDGIDAATRSRPERANPPMISSTLRCPDQCVPLSTHMTGGAFRSHLLARGVRHAPREEVRLKQPATILQTYLDEMAEAVLAERFEDYAARVHLPLYIRTSSAGIRVSTLESLQEGFDDFCDMIQSLGVTRIARTVKIASSMGNDHVVGIYETRMMACSKQVMPSFHSKMWIGTYSGEWKAIRIHNTTDDTRWPMLYTRLCAEPWPIEEL